MSERSFHFPLSILIRSAQQMHGALLEPLGVPVTRRLPADFTEKFAGVITQVSIGNTGQKSATGHTGQLTQAQNEALAEVKRLTSAARDTAKLTFAGNTVLLRQAFQVGQGDPVSLASILERAVTIQTSCEKYAAALSEHGWIADDTTALATAISALEGADDVQEAAKGDKKATTTAKNTAANKLYTLCQTVQNAAELSYPAHKAATDETVVAARARFLMDTFPPAPGASDEAEPVTTGTNPTTPTTT